MGRAVIVVDVVVMMGRAVIVVDVVVMMGRAVIVSCCGGGGDG